MGWQSGQSGSAGAGPEPSASGAGQERNPSLASFASRGGVDALRPSALLALAAEAAAGNGWRCPGATADERVGLVRAFAALESWAAAGKLGTIAEMVRSDDAPRRAGGRHGDLPDTWSPSLRHELALALACSVQSAETTTWLAWELQARLPGIGALLAAGTLTLAKARAVVEAFQYLTDADATIAEAMILDQLRGKTYPQVVRIAEQAALTVDPELAERRRLQAQKYARVTCFREQSGAACLSGRELPPDETLRAMASVNARAQEYEDSGAFGATPMDQLRSYAYLDLLNGVSAQDRIRCAVVQDPSDEIAEARAWANTRAARAAAQARANQQPAAETEPETGSAPAPQREADARPDAREPQRDQPADCPPGDDDGDDDDGDDDDGRGDDDDGEPPASGGGGPSGPSPRDPGPGDLGSKPGAPSGGRAFQKRPTDLTVPLATLLGLAERPGEAHGFGMLDPSLARDLAAAAAASPRTEICLTITSPEGFAIGHGCARLERTARPGRQPALMRPAGEGGAAPVPPRSFAGLPARLTLTVSVTELARLARHARPGSGTGQWRLTPRDAAGPPGGGKPPDGYGTWTLTLPDGRRCTVRTGTVPTLDCDHRLASPGYHPGARLRHFIAVRDGCCTFPTCNRHARESDFEHAIPFEKGGATCACNAGTRSRACHRVKQSVGWSVTQQPMPGWHRWTTPAGRVYAKEPKRYPA
jgi:hypothetical protein